MRPSTSSPDDGFRSIDEGWNQGFRVIQDPFQVSDLGGWTVAKADIIEAIWKQQILAEVGR